MFRIFLAIRYLLRIVFSGQYKYRAQPQYIQTVDQYFHVTPLTLYEFPSVTSLASHVVFVHNLEEDCPYREVGSTSVRHETSCRFVTRVFNFMFVVACQFCILSRMNGGTSPHALPSTSTLTLTPCVHLHFTYNIMCSRIFFPLGPI
jgi:hypothetical protein